MNSFAAPQLRVKKQSKSIVESEVSASSDSYFD